MSSGGHFDTPQVHRRIQEIDAISQSEKDFWSDSKTSSKLLKEKKELEDKIQSSRELQNSLEDMKVAYEFGLSGDHDYLLEASKLYDDISKTLLDFEIKTLLCEETDKNDAIVTINAGAGGTEACDWAQMIARMLIRYSESKGWKVHIVDELSGEEVGIKSLTLNVEGLYAFGHLKSEIGVHRLVRISPFDSNSKRHTSFCSVFVTAVVDDSIDINIQEKDLRIDTYRASGAGGQHVNKTDSAVRITHLPTGLVVQSQQERSQIQNREMCYKLLKSKLYELELDKKMEANKKLENSKLDNAFGSQIRSYVLHPYKMVKDLRTNLQVSQAEKVLDGEIDIFCQAFLKQKLVDSKA